MSDLHTTVLLHTVHAPDVGENLKARHFERIARLCCFGTAEVA